MQNDEKPQQQLEAMKVRPSGVTSTILCPDCQPANWLND